MNESHYAVNLQKFVFFAIVLCCASYLMGTNHCSFVQCFAPKTTSGFASQIGHFESTLMYALFPLLSSVRGDALTPQWHMYLQDADLLF